MHTVNKTEVHKQFLLVKSYEKSVKSWVKSKDFEICTPFLGVGDPSHLAPRTTFPSPGFR